MSNRSRALFSAHHDRSRAHARRHISSRSSRRTRNETGGHRETGNHGNSRTCESRLPRSSGSICLEPRRRRHRLQPRQCTQCPRRRVHRLRRLPHRAISTHRSAHPLRRTHSPILQFQPGITTHRVRTIPRVTMGMDTPMHPHHPTESLILRRYSLLLRRVTRLLRLPLAVLTRSCPMLHSHRCISTSHPPVLRRRHHQLQQHRRSFCPGQSYDPLPSPCLRP